MEKMPLDNPASMMSGSLVYVSDVRYVTLTFVLLNCFLKVKRGRVYLKYLFEISVLILVHTVCATYPVVPVRLNDLFQLHSVADHQPHDGRVVRATRPE